MSVTPPLPDHEHERKAERAAAFEAALAFARAEWGPVAAQIDECDEFPGDLWPRLAEQGFLGAGIPEQYGGAGGDYVVAAAIAEAFARVVPAIALSFGAHLNLCAHNILRNGTHEQRTRWLPGLCSGELVGALALTEPDAGSDAMGIRLRAERDDDSFLLTGTKTFITNGPVADVAVVYARTTPDAGSRGLTAFVVELPADGFSVSRSLDKVGHRGSPTGELAFDGVRVPASNVLGEVDGGYRIVMSGLDLERAFFSYLGIGVAAECLQLSLDYARERRQFGEPIATFQLVQAKLADMYAGLYSARSAADDALARVQRGERASLQAAAAVLVASEHAVRCAEEAVQIHGGYGYVKEFAAQRFWRDSKLGTIGAGTSEIRRLLIARELLGQR